MMETILRLYNQHSRDNVKPRSNSFSKKQTSVSQTQFYVPQNQGKKLIACKNGVPKEIGSLIKSEHDIQNHSQLLKDGEIVEFDQTFKELYNNLAFYTYAFKHKIFNILQNEPCDIIIMGTKQSINSCLEGSENDKGLLQLCVEDLISIVNKNDVYQIISSVISFVNNQKIELISTQNPIRSKEEFKGYIITVKNKIESCHHKEYQIQFMIKNNDNLINDPTNIDFYANYNSNISLICLVPNHTQYFQKYLDNLTFCSLFKNQKEKQEVMTLLSNFEKMINNDSCKNQEIIREQYLEIKKYKEKGFNNFLIDQILNDYIEKLYNCYQHIKQKKIALKLTMINKVDELTQLQETSEHYQQEINIMFDENKFILQETNKLKELIVYYQNKVSSLEQLLKNNLQQNGQLSENIQSSLQEKEKENQLIVEKYQNLEREYQKQSDEIKKYEHQVQNLLVIKTDQEQLIENHQIEFNGIKSRYDSEQDEKQKLKLALLKDNQFLKNQNQIISQNLETVNQEYQKTLTENEKIIEEMKILEVMATKQRKYESEQIDLLQKKSERKLQKMNDKIESMTQAYDDFNSQLQKKDKIIQNLEQQLKSSEKRVIDQQRFIEEQTNNVVRKNQESDVLSQNLINESQKLTKLNLENDLLKNQNHKQLQEYNSLKFQYEDLQKQKHTIQNSYSESDKIQKQINRELQNENSDLTQQLINIHSSSEYQVTIQFKGLNTFEDNLLLLTHQLERKNDENHFMQNQLLELQVQIQFFNEKIMKQENLNKKQKELLDKIMSKLGKQEHNLYSWVKVQFLQKRKSMDLQELS